MSPPGDPLASFRLDDRLIVVTGASEGIGRAFAEHFAAAGAQLVLASRRKDKLEEVRYLEGSIGKTGLLALKPFLHTSTRDLWQMTVLE